MARLRLGRTTVYEQARLYLATGGTEGIPCRRFGRSLRFPAAALDTTGDAVIDRAAQVIELAPRPATGESTRRSPAAEQTSLAFQNLTVMAVLSVLSPDLTKNGDALASAGCCRPCRPVRAAAAAGR